MAKKKTATKAAPPKKQTPASSGREFDVAAIAAEIVESLIVTGYHDVLEHRSMASGMIASILSDKLEADED